MAAASFDPFDEKTTCPKCGFKWAETAYCEGGKQMSHPFMPSGCRLCEISGEHIHRRCRRCGYVWEQAVLDSAAVPRPPHPMNEGPWARDTHEMILDHQYGGQGT